FRIVESRIVLRRAGQLRPRDDENHRMPQRRRQDRAVRDAPWNSAIDENIVRWIALRHARPLQKSPQLAEKIVMKAVPFDVQVRLAFSWQVHRDRVDFILPEQVKRINLESTKHQPLIITCSSSLPRGWRAGQRDKLVDERCKPRVYSAAASPSGVFSTNR